MTRQPRASNDGPLLWLLGVVVALGVLLWATAQLAALLNAHHSIALGAGDLPKVAVALPDHADDPRQAFPRAVRASLPGAVVMYAALAICLATVGGLAWMAVRHLGGDRSGYANRKEVNDQLSLRAARQRARQARPSLDYRRAAPNEVGLHLGRDVKTGIQLYGSVEDSYLYLGPPRSGKGVNLVIPALRT